MTQGDLEEACQHTKVAEATLESGRDIFEEGKECLEEDLDQVLVTKEEAKMLVQAVAD